jgi:hypothetical protein
VDTHNFQPTSIVGIKRVAKIIKGELGCNYTKALEEASSRAGFDSYAHGKRILDPTKCERMPSADLTEGPISQTSYSPKTTRWYVVTQDFESIDYLGEVLNQDYRPIELKLQQFRNFERYLDEHSTQAWVQCVATYGAPGAWFVVDSDLLVYLGQYASRAEAEFARVVQEQGAFEELVSYDVARHWRF